MQDTTSLLIHAKGRTEKGAVLMGGMIMLTLMTLIGVTSIKSSILEEKMAGNNREKHRSFEISEMTLSIADGHLVRQDDILPFFAGAYSGTGSPSTNGLYKIGASHPWENHNNWEAGSGNSLEVNDPNVPASVRISAGELAQLDIATPPRYMMGLDREVELDGMDSSIPQKFFRFYLTGQARGGIETIKTTLQTEALRAY